MSEEFSPHEHAVEHQAEHGDRLAMLVAAFTAVLAAISGYLHYREGVVQTEAMMHKNTAVLYQSKASDQWNFYQASSNKGHLMEYAQDTAPPDRKAYYAQQVAKYNRRKADISKRAQQLEAQVEKENKLSEDLERPQHAIGRSLAMLNVAISLAALTSLTRIRALFLLAALFAVAGIAMSGNALLAV